MGKEGAGRRGRGAGSPDEPRPNDHPGLRPRDGARYSVVVAVALPSVAEVLALGSEVLVVCGLESLVPVVPGLVSPESPVLGSTPMVLPPDSLPELSPLELVSPLSIGSQTSPMP